ncbi:SsrA-binding protein SmpB [Candidatus Bipolaricaulota bacterium]|nr:SsrA-binding protein SmpB [Candidatus Bipolaricaulota bacterium]
MSSVVATNRKARHDFTIEDTIEAGISLTGTEVKSLRDRRCSLQEGYAVVREGTITLKGVHIAPFQQGAAYNVEPLRDRQLLLHRREIRKLATKLQERGYTLVPLSIYFKHGRAKVELGVAKGKNTYDKRQKLRDDDVKRRTDEALKKFSRGQKI